MTTQFTSIDNWREQAGRDMAKTIAFKNDEYANRLYEALSSWECDGAAQDRNLSGVFVRGVTVAPKPGQDGRVVVTLTYGYVKNTDREGELLGGGITTVRDLHSPDTLASDLQAIANSANAVLRREGIDALDFRKRIQRTFIEQVGRFCSNAVKTKVSATLPYTSGDARSYHERVIAAQPTDLLSEDDLLLIATHPLATDEKRREAREMWKATPRTFDDVDRRIEKEKNAGNKWAGNTLIMQPVI